MGVLIWEESLGWGNTPRQMSDGEYFRLQVEQTREMVRASFNHPSVIIFAFQNENHSQTKPGKTLTDALIEAIRSQASGRLVTPACNHNGDDISNANTDLVSFNAYPGWIGSDARTYHRGGSNIRVKLLAENLAGLYDGYRRAKMATQVVREGFSRKAAGEQ